MNLDLVLDSLSDGFISLDHHWRIQYINPACRRLLGISNEQLELEVIWEQLPSQIIAPLFAKLDMAKTNHISRNVDLYFPDHEYKWLEINVYLSIQGLSVIFKDISARKEVEQTILHNHKRLVLLCEAANEMIFNKGPKELLDSLFDHLSAFLDLDVYFNYILRPEKNKLQLLNYHGIPPEVAKEIEWLELGQAVCGCVARDQHRIVAEHIDQSADPRVELVKGFGIKAYACYPLMSFGRLLGTLSFGSSKRTQFTTDELDLIETICNQVATSLERTFFISELQMKNTNLELANQQLRENEFSLIQAKAEAEKGNRAKIDFLSLMSHELRTPLNTILGFSQILMEDPSESLSDKGRERIGKIYVSGNELLHLINNILELVRVDEKND